MSFSLFVENLSSEQIAFGYSAAHETMVALHVFHDCKHHPLHIPWVMKARKKITPALKDEIEAFSIFYQRPIIPFWELQEESAIRSLELDLKVMLEQPIEAYVQKIIDVLLNRGVPYQEALPEFLDLCGHRYPQSKEVIKEVVEHPVKSRQRFIQMLEAFWHACLKEEWPVIEESFLKDITLRGRILIKEGPLSLLASLSKEIDSYPAEKRAVIRRISKKEIRFSEKDRLFLAPTYFAWPHLFVTHDKPIGINYSIMEQQLEAQQPMPPEDLLKFFRALGDFTRMQIVKYLALKPRSTRELAVLIGVTEGAVSKHLKVLGEAGLITSKRESYYVFYHLVEKPFSDLPSGLAQFLKPC